MSEPAAESPVETAEDEIPDKAEELNTDEIKVKESGAIDPTKRRLELWNQSTSRKLMVQIQQNRVCSICCRAHRSPFPRNVLQVVTCRNPIIHRHSLMKVLVLPVLVQTVAL